MPVIERRQQERRRPLQALHFRCPHCPFEGSEEDMINHAMDCGHVAVLDDSRMLDEGCPNGD